MSKHNKKDKRHGAQVIKFPAIPPEGKPPIDPNALICIRGPIYGSSGYSRMARNLIEGMHLAGKNFWVDAIPWMIQPTIELPESFKNIIKAHMITYDQTNKTSAFVCVCLPTDLPNRPIGQNTWNMTIFETNQVPDQWVRVLTSASLENPGKMAINGLILPCQGNLKSFAGAPQYKVIVPLPIDYDVFTPDGPQADMPYRSDFNILLSFHQNPRKNPDLVLRLINELDQNTTVYLKTYGIGMSSWERREIAELVKARIKPRCQVVLLYDLITDEDQAKMYRAMDLVLNVSHGEGWDMPRHEAYACGVPAIGTLFVGPEDYTIPEFKLIKHELMPCPELPPYYSSVQKWAELDLVDVLRAINTVRENQKQYGEFALKQRDHLMKLTGTMADAAEKVWKAVM